MDASPTRPCGGHQSSQFNNTLCADAAASGQSAARAEGSHQSGRGARASAAAAPPAIDETVAHAANAPLHIIHVSSGSRRERIMRAVMKGTKTREKLPRATKFPVSTSSSTEDVAQPVLLSQSGSDWSTDSSVSTLDPHEPFGPAPSATGSVKDTSARSAVSLPRATHPLSKATRVWSDEDQGQDEIGTSTADPAMQCVGECKPCAYAKRNKCINGRDCKFCHVHQPTTNRPRPCKKQRAQVKRAVAMMQQGCPDTVEQFVDDLRGRSSDTGLKQGYLRHYLAVMARMQETREDGARVSPGSVDQSAGGPGQPRRMSL